jgi:receptor protein-tyrosine kinase
MEKPDITINGRIRESIAQLCSSLYLGTENPPSLLAVTSADAREGRSSVALALGIELAETLNQKVLVVEGNLRNPGIGKLASLPKSTSGFSELLMNGDKPEEYVLTFGAGFPDILPAGETDPNQFGKLLNRDKLVHILHLLSGSYKYIILETPPVNHYPEAQLFLGMVDGVVLTIRSGVTSRETVSLAMKKINSVGGKVLGLVLNQKQFPLPNWLYKRL